MSLKDDVLPIIDSGWGLVEFFGFSDTTVTVRTRTWSSGQLKLGAATVEDLTLSPKPPVKEMGDKDLLVGPITPTYTGNGGGGYSYAQLRPTEVPGVEYYYVVTAADGVARPFRLKSIDTSEEYEWYLRLESLDRAVPF